ncbi:MAG TPA: gamma-glutamyltransferase [Nitrolancea sp.]|nr:gamma-glutamyltransferase [Nitrolancea sp.]
MSTFQMSQWLVEKTGASSDGGMVVAKQDQAALAGARMLAEGGNAVDAAVAAAFVMNVMEPYNTSIGGAGYMVFRSADGAARVIDFSNQAPRRATPEAHKSRTTVAFSGGLAAMVPGTVAGLATALERFGTLDLAHVLEPAIDLAENGMPLSWVLALRLLQELNGLRANPKSAEIFLVNGDPGMAHGATVVRQTDLARTLREIGTHGPEAFYTGAIAREIVDFVQEQGGVLELDDMACYQPSVVRALRSPFRDYQILTGPLPCPGLMTIQGLKIADGFDLVGMGHNSAESLHVLAESYRLAFADRDAYFGDPEFVDVPCDLLLSEEYIARRRAQIDVHRAMRTVEPGDIGMVPAGKQAGGGGTTQISVVDSAGNAVSMTHTLIGGWTGLGIAGNTGVVMNCAAQWFDPTPGSPNSVAPRKRPVSNMTPLIVERNDRAVLAVGSPGSRRITNAVSQVVLNTLVYDMDVQRAISAPRIDLSQGYIVADDRIDAKVVDGLRDLGHRVETVYEFINAGGPASGYRGYFARPAAVFVDDAGMRHGGDYPFLEGMAVGVPRSSE